MKSGRGVRVWIRLMIAALGAMFLLDEFGVWEFAGELVWPVFLIGVGAAMVIQRRSGRWLGGLLGLLGVMFLLDALEVIDFGIGDIWRFWPVILVLVGARLIFGRNRRRRRSSRKSRSDEQLTDLRSGELDMTTCFGQAEQRVTSRNFSGGNATVLFGSGNIDLRQATLAEDGASMDVSVVLGSSQIWVPESWSVEIQLTSLLGSVDDKRVHKGSGRADITINGFCLLGSVEVFSVPQEPTSGTAGR